MPGAVTGGDWKNVKSLLSFSEWMLSWTHITTPGKAIKKLQNNVAYRKLGFARSDHHEENL